MNDEPIPWMADALCAQVGGDAWFPTERDGRSAARKLCRGCPVIVECLEHAMRNNETHGVWGGLTVGQRRALRRRENAA